MAKILEVTDSFGTHQYNITKETPEIIETDSTTLADNQPLRFNKREGRVEVLTDAGWEVYISDSSIVQVDIVNKATSPAPASGMKPGKQRGGKSNASKYKPSSMGRLCSLCRSHAKGHDVETPYAEWCSSNGKCVGCGRPTREKHWYSRTFFRDFPIPESLKYTPRRRRTEME